MAKAAAAEEVPPWVATVRTAADPRLAAFGAEVRRRRRAMRLSQADLALKMGHGHESRTSSYVSRVESGRTSPSLVTAWRLADALGCDLADLLGGLTQQRGEVIALSKDSSGWG